MAQSGSTDFRGMAVHYFSQNDYEKAAIYYLKLWEETKKTGDFEKYYTCLLELKMYKEAEKLIKKELKKKYVQLSTYLLYGDLFAHQDNDSKAIQQYELAVRNINSYHSFSQISQLANGLQIRSKIDLAINAYQKAQKVSSNPVSYSIRIGELYGVQGKTELMIREFLLMLETNVGYRNQVQNALSRSIDFKVNLKETELLRIELLRLTQKHPGKTIYNEMLIWLFQQKGDFKSAFVQVKAQDRKLRANGKRVFEFGEVCSNNESYDLALEAFQYVIDLGKENKYYRTANYRSLNTLKKKITNSSSYTKEDLINLESKYNFTLDEVGRAPHSINTMMELGHLQGFYLQKFSSAIAILEEAITLAARVPKVQGKCKMLLADVLLISGEIWDASLYYSQVDKAFKEDVLSHEAKFKNAKIFYYTANFALALSQLDVLKSSTQKLIANDAMELSLLITDNLALDTTANTMRMYAEADLLTSQHRFEEAIGKFDSINIALPYHSLNDEILMKKYEIDFRKQNYEQAAARLTEIVTKYGEDILADNALFLLGEMYQNVFKDEIKAAEYYKNLFLNYTGSMFGIEAKKRYRKLTENLPGSSEFKEIE
jgi:outer membrane protein assembly factor BamD (BamD/ComL family)